MRHAETINISIEPSSETGIISEKRVYPPVRVDTKGPKVEEFGKIITYIQERFVQDQGTEIERAPAPRGSPTKKQLFTPHH